jgi:hypothetical protein
MASLLRLSHAIFYLVESLSLRMQATGAWLPITCEMERKWLTSLNVIFILYLCIRSYEELHNLYSSPDIIRQVKSRRMRWAGHVARMGEETKVYKVVVGKPEVKRPLGRPRRRFTIGRLNAFRSLTLWSRSSSKCYLRIQSVPQREHNTSPLQRSTG